MLAELPWMIFLPSDEQSSEGLSASVVYRLGTDLGFEITGLGFSLRLVLMFVFLKGLGL